MGRSKIAEAHRAEFGDDGAETGDRQVSTRRRKLLTDPHVPRRGRHIRALPGLFPPTHKDFGADRTLTGYSFRKNGAEAPSAKLSQKLW